MEERTGSPIAVKVEGNSHSVILTYFQGDANSMVDEHFTRALSKINKSSEPSAKSKKVRKSVKMENTNTGEGSVTAPYQEAQVTPIGGHILSLGPPENMPGSWGSFRARDGPALSTIMCSLSSEGLSLTGQQYSTSLLNLLHGDRGDMGPSMASSSKPEPLPSWTVPPGLRESIDPSLAFEPGQHVDKKDLYWY